MAAQTRTAQSDQFGIKLSTGSKTNLSNIITTTEYVKDGNNVSPTNVTNGSASKLWVEVGASDYTKLPDSEKFTSTVGNTKYYKLVGEYNTDGQRKWSTTQHTGADLANEMILYNDRKPSNLTNAINASNKAVAKDAGVPEAGLNNKLFNPANPAAPAIDPATPSTAAGNTAPTPVNAEALGKKIGEATGRKDTYGELIYPRDISTYQDKIRFTILQYKPRGLSFSTFGGDNTGLLDARSSTEGRTSLGTITLPIPGGISDTNTAGWSDDRMDPFKMALANAALETIMNGGQAGANAAGAAANQLTDPNVNADTRGAVANATVAAAVQGDGGLLLSRTQGAVINPNLELLFSGPELRSFNFTFKMSARNQPEGDMIVKIIRAFKQASAPQRTKSQLFVKAPNTFAISYLRGGDGKPHTRIGRIKECALVSINTNYTPEGQYATFSDGTPVSYEIQLQFKELEPIFNSDYEAQGITRNDLGY